MQRVNQLAMLTQGPPIDESVPPRAGRQVGPQPGCHADKKALEFIWKLRDLGLLFFELGAEVALFVGETIEVLSPFFSF